MPTHLPIQRVTGVLSLGVKRMELEADYSPPSSAEIKNGGAMPIRLHDMVLIN
jgi:hypothetical protein